MPKNRRTPMAKTEHFFREGAVLLLDFALLREPHLHHLFLIFGEKFKALGIVGYSFFARSDVYSAHRVEPELYAIILDVIFQTKNHVGRHNEPQSL